MTQTDYDALKRQHDDVTAQLTSANQKEADLRDTLSKKVDEGRTRDEAHRQELAALNEAMQALDIERIELEQQLAKIMRDRGELESSIEEMQQALSELRRRRAAAERRVAAYRDLIGRFQALIDAGALSVKIVDGRMVVQMQTDVLFSSGSAELSSEGRQAIANVTAVLADIPDRRYQVEGHTDDVPISTKKYPSNWELASARALNVVKEMTSVGLAAQRVSAASFSEYRPTASNADEGSRAQNRRIEIVVVPNLNELPGAEELNRIGR